MTVTPAKYNDFKIYQGATFNEPLTFRDPDNALIDLTGYTARMSIKKKYTDVIPVISLTTENDRIVNGGDDGTLTLNISASDTEQLSPDNYIYDLELVSGQVVDRYMQGVIQVAAEVTK